MLVVVIVTVVMVDLTAMVMVSNHGVDTDHDRNIRQLPWFY